MRLGWFDDPFVTQSLGGMFEHLAVHVITHRSDMPGLFSAQQVARPTDFQVTHGNLEPRAEHCVLLNSAESLDCFVIDGAIFRQHEIAIRAMLVSPDTPTQLVEFSKTEDVRLVDDHGVGGGDVDA